MLPLAVECRDVLTRRPTEHPIHIQGHMLSTPVAVLGIARVGDEINDVFEDQGVPAVMCSDEALLEGLNFAVEHGDVRDADARLCFDAPCDRLKDRIRAAGACTQTY